MYNRNILVSLSQCKFLDMSCTLIFEAPNLNSTFDFMSAVVFLMAEVSSVCVGLGNSLYSGPEFCLAHDVSLWIQHSWMHRWVLAIIIHHNTAGPLKIRQNIL